jgi:hypothetical protein
VSDHWRGELLPSGMGYRGDARRETPIIDRQPIGPWRARVRVTPLTGIKDTTVFEVSAAWEDGPPLLCMQEQWDPAVHRRQAALDVAQVDDIELARALALEAADLLRDGVRFDLQQLAQRRAARA